MQQPQPNTTRTLFALIAAMVGVWALALGFILWGP